MVGQHFNDAKSIVPNATFCEVSVSSSSQLATPFPFGKGGPPLGGIHFHPKTISSTDTFIQKRFHPIFDTFIQTQFHPMNFSSNDNHPTVSSKKISCGTIKSPRDVSFAFPSSFGVSFELQVNLMEIFLPFLISKRSQCHTNTPERLASCAAAN